MGQGQAGAIGPTTAAPATYSCSLGRGKAVARPILTVALLRLFLWVAPPINYALALSTVRYRDYAAGSALGLAIPTALAAVVFGYLFR